MWLSSSHRKTWWITSVYGKQKRAVWEWEWFFVLLLLLLVFNLCNGATWKQFAKRLLSTMFFFSSFFHFFRSLNKVNLIRLLVMCVKLWNCFFFCKPITYLSISLALLSLSIEIKFHWALVIFSHEKHVWLTHYHVIWVSLFIFLSSLLLIVIIALLLLWTFANNVCFL